MTKAQRIATLLKRGKSTRQVALEVYGADCDIQTRMAYVRMVKQRADDKGRERDLAWQRAYYHNNPKRKASVRARASAFYYAAKKRAA